jgi:hypothetical protein
MKSSQGHHHFFENIQSNFFKHFLLAITMVTTRHQASLAKAEEQEEEEEEEVTDDRMVDQTEDPGGPVPGSAADFVNIGADIMNRSPPSIFSGGHSRAFNE